MELCASATVYDCGTAVEFFSQVISLIFGVIVVEVLLSTPKFIWYNCHLLSLSYVACIRTKNLVLDHCGCGTAIEFVSA